MVEVNKKEFDAIKEGRQTFVLALYGYEIGQQVLVELCVDGVVKDTLLVSVDYVLDESFGLINGYCVLGITRNENRT